MDDLDDGVDGDVRLLLVPAIVVRAHRQQGIAHLRFPGQRGLGNGGHADDGGVHGAAVEVRFGPGRELGAFHAHVGAALVDGGPTLAPRLDGEPPQIVTERIRHRDVADDAVTEEGGRPDPLGAVEQLVGHDHLARLDVFLHDADGTHGQHVRHFELLEGVDVGSGIDLRRHDPVPPAVSRQEEHGTVVDAGVDDAVGGTAEGGFDVVLADDVGAFHLVDPRAADDPQANRCGRSFRHVSRSILVSSR